ncbi:MAG: 2Fe-2S iron-sulfur cluster binding domain-containing protein [Amphritea sp.]
MAQHKITVTNKGKTQVCDCRDGQTLAQALMFSNVIPFACVGGGCGICRVQISSGRYRAKWMNRNYVSVQEQEEGLALACLIHPRSDMEIEVMGRKPKPFQTSRVRSKENLTD